MEDTEYKKHQKVSYISAFLSLIGFIIIAGSLVFSYSTIKQKENRVKELTQKEHELTQTVKDLNLKRQDLTVEEQRLQLLIKKQKKRIEDMKWASSPEAIVVQGKKVKLDDIFTKEGYQLYDYIIWLQIPVLLKDKITKVHYLFDNPSMLKRNRYETESSNGFSTAYRGYSCLKSVDITVHFIDGGLLEFVFDQCLGTQKERRKPLP